MTDAPFDDESLPRDNGELVFDAPWQARALAIAVAVVERLDLPWDAFRRRLMAEIADGPAPPVLRKSGARRSNHMVVDTGSRDTPPRSTPPTPTERAAL